MSFSKKGFSILEIIIVIFIISIVFVSLFYYLRGSFSVVLKEDDRIEIQQNIRYALSFISQYLQEADEVYKISEQEIEFRINTPFYEKGQVCIKRIRFHSGISSTKKAILMDVKMKCRGEDNFKTVQVSQPIAFISNVKEFNNAAYLKFRSTEDLKGIIVNIKGIMSKPAGKPIDFSILVCPELLKNK